MSLIRRLRERRERRRYDLRFDAIVAAEKELADKRMREAGVDPIDGHAEYLLDLFRNEKER